MTTISGVTVDLDDTLFPQQAWLDGAWSTVAARADTLGLDGAALHRALRRIAAEGSDRGQIIDRALTAAGVRPERYVGELVAAFHAHRPDRLPAYRGALEALADLRQVLPVAVVTDGVPEIQHGKLAALGLADVPAIVSDELGSRRLRKPHPAPFRRALYLMGVPAGRAVHIGDRPAKDVLGAHGVGMRCVRVRTGEYASVEDEPAAQPWQVADSFADAASRVLAAVRGTAAASSRL